MNLNLKPGRYLKSEVNGHIYIYDAETAALPQMRVVFVEEGGRLAGDPGDPVTPPAELRREDLEALYLAKFKRRPHARISLERLRAAVKMGTIPAQAIIDQASTQLLDEDNVRWPEPELLGYLNDGQRLVVLMRPESGATTSSVQLAMGTKQTLPAGGLMLLDVVRNMGLDGTTLGRAIRVTSREVLDSQAPNWHTATAKAEVRNFVYDPRNPLTFYVTPPQPATPAYVELVFVRTPTDLAITDPIQLDDVFAPTLMDYVLYRAYGKDSEYGAEMQLAIAHFQAFAQSLGVSAKELLLRNPNLMPTPLNPQVPAAAR